MSLINQLYQGLRDQCDDVYGVINPGAERVILFLARYIMVFALPFFTPIYQYYSYPDDIRYLYYIFMAIGGFMAYVILLDTTVFIQRALKRCIKKSRA